MAENENTALDTVKTILGITDTASDTDLAVYLGLAQKELISWCYGKDSLLTELPAWLEPVQIMAVVTAWNQKGGEGETYESVDGLAHTFRYDTIIAYIHDNAPAYAKVI